MVDICPKCGNYDWDKTVDGNRIACPKCGRSWAFLKLPLFIVTGASGVGKTTTVQALQGFTRDFVCLDADFFYNLMPHETEEDYMAQTEQAQALSRDVMQCGRPVVWARAGNIHLLDKTYGARFFSGISVLALVCGEQQLRQRMAGGRGIEDPEWIQSSVDYNRYFIEHDHIDSVGYDRLDIGPLTVEDAARAVHAWLRDKMESSQSRADIYEYKK